MLRLEPWLSRVNTLAFSPDNRYLLAVGVKPLVGGLLTFSRVILWDLSDPAAKPRHGIEGSLDPTAGFFLPDGRILGIDSRGWWSTWEPGDRNRTLIEGKPSGRWHPAAVSPDGEWLALLSRGRVRCDSLRRDESRFGPRRGWDISLDDGQEATGAAFSPDSRLLAVTVRGWWGHERVWGVNLYTADAGEFIRWVDAEDDAFAPVWSADGRFLAVVGRTGFDVWDAQTWNAQALRQPAGVRFTAATFHPSGPLVTTTDTGQVQFWDAGEWERPFVEAVAARPPARVLEWGVGPVQALAFSPDGSLGAVAGAHGDVVVWDADE
jgi:WD40 repeat protein